MRVHDSQTDRKVVVTRERVSRSWELREILLSFQTGSHPQPPKEKERDREWTPVLYCTERTKMVTKWFVNKWFTDDYLPSKFVHKL